MLGSPLCDVEDTPSVGVVVHAFATYILVSAMLLTMLTSGSSTAWVSM